MSNASATPRNRPSPPTAANPSRVPFSRPASLRCSHSRAKSGGVGSGTRVKRRTSGSASMAATAARWDSFRGSRRTDSIGGGETDLREVGVPTQDEKAERFRALHEGDAFIIPNPWDAGSAKVFAALGFHALATTSSGFAFTLGRADGNATLDEVVAH